MQAQLGEGVTAKLPCDVVMIGCDLGALTQRYGLQHIRIPRDGKYSESADTTATDSMVAYVCLLILNTVFFLFCRW